MSTTRRLRLAVLAAAASLAFASLVAIHPAAAQSSIKLLVNDEPVTTYDIRNRAQLLRLTTGGKAGEKQAEEELIEERLKLQEAKKRNVSVDPAEVEQAYGNMARRSKLTPAQLTQALSQAGVNPETLKDRIRAEIAWRQIVRARFRATSRVTDQDVAEALAGTEGAAGDGAEQMVSEYMVQQILFVVPAKSGDAVAGQRKNEANAFRNRFQGCDTAVDLAKSLKGVVVKPPVRREESQLNPSTLEAFATMQVGQTTAPERVQEGFQVLALCGKNAIAGQSKAGEEIRDELVNERGQMMARRYLRDLRSDAVLEYR